jgi:hypothetical protein
VDLGDSVGQAIRGAFLSLGAHVADKHAGHDRGQGQAVRHQKGRGGHWVRGALVSDPPWCWLDPLSFLQEEELVNACLDTIRAHKTAQDLLDELEPVLADEATDFVKKVRLSVSGCARISSGFRSGASSFSKSWPALMAYPPRRHEGRQPSEALLASHTLATSRDR